MLRPFERHPGIVLMAVFLWKFLLLLTTAQPIPFSDSFFYDGAVVNLINGGAYCNPSLELVLPISGTKIFSAYPPLYQFVLWLWLSIFGASALSAMWLHLMLYGVFCFALLAILRRLNIPALWINFGCLFLFGITFHDRPDSLGFALGFWAWYAWLRAGDDDVQTGRGRWMMLAVGLHVLTFATSLQLGALFWGGAVLLALAAKWAQGQRIFWLGLLVSVGLPVLLGAYVKFMHPALWAGFQEHVRETPVLMGLKAANHSTLMISQVLKLARSVPAVFLAMLCVGLVFAKRQMTMQNFLQTPANRFLIGALVVSAGLTMVITIFLVMVVHWIMYFQVLIVAGTFALLERAQVSAPNRKALIGGFLLLALIVGSRGLGMSTWGVANARDVSYATARQQVHDALSSCATNSTAVVSAAFLYEANTVSHVQAIHADWLSSHHQPANPVLTLLKLRPQKLVLTQFDWHRNYEATVTRLAQERAWIDVQVTNVVRLPVPDSSRVLQKVLQHTSWAPVIIELQWKPGAPE